MLLINGDRQAWADMSPEEEARITEGHRAFLAVAGAAVLDGGELDAPERAASVRSRHGVAPQVTEGPFTGSAEAVGGYYILEAADLDEAVRLASLLPETSAPYRAGVEVRQLLNGV
ncbi:YciI family protein [Ornithinimicrobium pekingense]|nr:YciI family protein [Ornithinimicrobium pekingense]